MSILKKITFKNKKKSIQAIYIYIETLDYFKYYIENRMNKV